MKMLPDEQMEEQFVDFVIDEALSDKEESMLMEQLEANPELSMIFDKVIEKASEFTGAGEVEGPGTGTSDSIPARLSDGEICLYSKISRADWCRQPHENDEGCRSCLRCWGR